MANIPLVFVFVLVFLLGCGGRAEQPSESCSEMIARVKAAGWAPFEVLTADQMNDFDEKQVLMTDSRCVPDYFWATNYGPVFGVDARNGVYSPVHSRWVFLGGTSGSPVSFHSIDLKTFTAGGVVPGGNGYATRAMAVSSSGTVVAVGDSSAAKVRRTTDGGANWSQVVVAADVDVGNDWTSLVWHELSNAFIAGGQPGKLWVSFDEGLNWQEVTLPNGWAGRIVDSIASNGNLLIAMRRLEGSAQTEYLRTENPLDWSSLTFQSSRTTCVVWSEYTRAFVAAGQPSLVSGDGLAWSVKTDVPSLSGNPGACAVQQNVILVTGDDGQVHLSSDSGTSWSLVLDAPSGSVNFSEIASGDGRFVVFASNGTDSRASLRFSM